MVTRASQSECGMLGMVSRVSPKKMAVAETMTCLNQWRHAAWVSANWGASSQDGKEKV
jgi:hypothetical protein